MSNIQLFDEVYKLLSANSLRIKVLDCLPKAKVPIIKCEHIPTRINIDITFNKIQGVKQINYFENAKESYPEFPFLYLFFKFFLKQRRKCQKPIP